MTEATACPRCGAAIPHDATWERLHPIAGRQEAWRNTHERPTGKPGSRKCVIYGGPPVPGDAPGAAYGTGGIPASLAVY